MIKNIQLVLIFCFVFSLMFISIPSTGYACSCAELPSVEGELERSEGVFAGKVIEIKENKTLNGVMTKSVLFKVENTWKGISQSQVIISTGIGGGDCGYEFEEGKEYLVYSSNSKVYSGNNLSTTICRRTNDLAFAQEDLVVLGEGKPPTEQVNLEGEFRGFSPYVWVLVIGIVGIVAFLTWRRSRR
jgi:hypothetical protein